ncbi:putative Transcriptional regulator, MarR family protein [Nitrosotalea sinensis]|jgi:MarR family transcriptional regulator for hemolysin|uniref:Putative Transcriptional regulator, MarR family protein n=1 Tax=Nitrosotalea sinensis TaxID=1499975 RepID=A0A2H1EIN5_9ARCH|nr:MarR family winged helix-turn-helix transcriptional regulator [Candidatus Nitrosotalea sinensis]SHO47696.1 putative Transcriptional regulator, MarR family protein [Candidatus Nitrosotalea sinensis]
MTRYDFENSIGFVVNATAKAFQRSFDVELRKNVGVTLSQWRVVWALMTQPGLTQKELADKVGIEGATLVPIIDKMEKENLLKRKPDSNDRRANRIYLMPKSDSLWESMMDCAIKIRKSSTKNISDDEVRITLETLRKISKNLMTFSELDAIQTKKSNRTG